MQSSEEDWTHLMALCGMAPERYSERVLVVSGREVEVRVVTDLCDEESEGLGLASCHVGLEVDYRGEAKIVEVVKFDRIPSWEKIAFEVEMWIERNDPWSWQGEATH